MVYCGKPSRGCQMCRTRRIKCDETKPTCHQCQKSRRQCPGYKDDFDLVFRNETQATERRARKASNGQKFHSNVNFISPNTSYSTVPDLMIEDGAETLQTPSPDSDTVMGLRPLPALTIPVDEQAPCYFMSNYVITPRHAARGYFDFLMPMLKTESADSPIALAFSAVALAALGGRPDRRGSCWRGDSFLQYTRALRAVNLAHQNPAQQLKDSTLASIVMLGFFENMVTERGNASAWFSHIEGAVQVVKLRGKKQLRTKIGYSLFACVRNQMVIQCMASGKPPALGSEWWISDFAKDDIGVFSIKLNLRVSELRHEINGALATYSRTPENFQKVMDLMKRAQALEQEYQDWQASLPSDWRARTVAWVDQIPGGEIAKAEVCPGRVDMYNDVWLANTWNHTRVARLFISGAIVRCAAWICSPVDYRTTPEYAQSVRLCVDLVTDIIASIPYHLGWRVGSNGTLTTPGDMGSPLTSETFSCPKALGGFFCLWPLFAINNSDYPSDSQRNWAKGRLVWISENLGLKHAKVLSSFQLRLPSMIIRRDCMLHTPPSAQMIAAAAARGYAPGASTASMSPSPPLTTPSPNPNQTPTSNSTSPIPVLDRSGTSWMGAGNVGGAAGNAGNAGAREGGYVLNPLQQREAMQREAWEKERSSLLKKASNSQGDSVERLVRAYLAV